MLLLGCIYIYYFKFSVILLCYHLSNLLYLYHTEVMVELYFSQAFFQSIIFTAFLYHTICYIFHFSDILYNFTSLCLELIYCVVLFYSKIFHFRYHFDIADVFRLFSLIKYHHTTLTIIYFKSIPSAYLSNDIHVSLFPWSHTHTYHHGISIPFLLNLSSAGNTP